MMLFLWQNGEACPLAMHADIANRQDILLTLVNGVGITNLPSLNPFRTKLILLLYKPFILEVQWHIIACKHTCIVINPLIDGATKNKQRSDF